MTERASPPVWIELHVDDELVGHAPWRAPEAALLLRRVAALAEERGARLSFRVRAPLASSAEGRRLLPDLAARGHEIGVHAHGRGLGEALDAVRACGLQPHVATPGLVQVGASGRAALLRQAASLGFRLVTDHGPQRAWAYEGLLSREEEGLVVMAPAVRPFDWGLYSPEGARGPLTREAVTRLRALERAAAGQGAAFFGAALHEHDLCAPGCLAPLDIALDALAELLDARVVPSLSLAPPLRPAPLASPRPLSDRRVRLARAVAYTTALARRARPGLRLPTPGGTRLDIGKRFLVLERHGPAAARALVLLSHAGRLGGRRQGLSPFGLGLADLLDQGYAVYLYDRAGTGKSPADGPLTPGNAAHVEDWRAVLALARQEGLPVLAVSWSAGLLPVLRAAARGERPDALVDGEGPADRWSLVPPEGNELSDRDPWRDALWAGLEPVALISTLDVPYARLQAELDHVHGAMHEHARRLVAAARAAGLAVHDAGVLPGRLHGNPGALLEALAWAEARLGERP